MTVHFRSARNGAEWDVDLDSQEDVEIYMSEHRLDPDWTEVSTDDEED